MVGLNSIKGENMEEDPRRMRLELDVTDGFTVENLALFTEAASYLAGEDTDVVFVTDEIGCVTALSVRA